MSYFNWHKWYWQNVSFLPYLCNIIRDQLTQSYNWSYKVIIWIILIWKDKFLSLSYSKELLTLWSLNITFVPGESLKEKHVPKRHAHARGIHIQWTVAHSCIYKLYLLLYFNSNVGTVYWRCDLNHSNPCLPVHLMIHKSTKYIAK